MDSYSTTKRKCQICSKKRSHAAISKSSIFSYLLRDMAICKIEEMLVVGKNSVTHVCYECSFLIIGCSFRVRGAISRRYSVDPLEPFETQCKICKVGEKTHTLVVNNADRAMKLALFKLTDEYLEATGEELYTIYFCTNCYTLLNDMNVLLKKFYDPSLSV